MAEAAAALYAVETVIEGAAVGAWAVSKTTTPLNIRFRRLTIPSSSFDASVASTLSVIKGQAYVFGGDSPNGKSDGLMQVITLPSNIENGELDFRIVQPELETSRPLQMYNTISTSNTNADGFEKVASTVHDPQQREEPKIEARAFHASTNIGSNIFILGGRSPRSTQVANQSPAADAGEWFDCGRIDVFSTQSHKWTILHADLSRCANGVPPPRIGASCTSSSHPQPDSGIDITVQSHGTVFLHGGHDAQGQLFRDTWAFDVTTRVWTRWPDLPAALAEEIAGEGRIVCIKNRLWRAGDGFGKMLYLDFHINSGDVVGNNSGPHHQETGVQPQSRRWEIVSFGEKATHPALQSEEECNSEKPLTDKAETLPAPRQGAGFVPVQLGAGRAFLLYFMGQDGPGSFLGDVWSFQVDADNASPAAVKDAVRTAVGKDSGIHKWAPCDIIESTKKEGQVHPPRGLGGFAADSWKDLGGGNVLLWGGMETSGELEPRCWLMSVE